VAGYYGQGTLGGGLFQYTGEINANSRCPGVIPDDQGVIVVAGSGATSTHCYQRIFSGAVHLSWYGVAPNGTADTNPNLVANSAYCLGYTSGVSNRHSCNVSDKVIKAFAATSAYGNGRVTSDGVPFVWWPTDPAPPLPPTNLVIGPNQSLDCGMPPGSFLQQDVHPYYKQPNFIVLHNTDAVDVQARAEISNCGIIPSWYIPDEAGNVPYTDIGDLIGASHQFAGTALLMDDEGALAHDLFIVGFDVCAVATKSPRAHLYNGRGDCNVGVWSHAQKGGFEVNNFVSKEFFFLQYSNSLGRIASFLTPVQNISGGGANGQMMITYAVPSGGDPIVNGDTVLVQGFGDDENVNAMGDVGVGSGSTCAAGAKTICNVTPDSVFSKPVVGSVVTGTCIPNHTYVTDADADHNKITLSQADSCNLSGVSLTFKIDNVSPFAANGRWVVSCGASCNGTATLVGSNWIGPAVGNATWPTGRQFISVNDTTNIAPGQFACATATLTHPYEAFCSPGTGWGVGSASLSGSWSSGKTGGTLTLKTGTTAGWPSSGYIKIGPALSFEALCYDSITSSTSINISERGCDGTVATSHSDGDAIGVAAPQVIAVSPKNNVAILNATASTAGAQSITFANDQTVVTTFPGGGTGKPIGGIGMSPAYKYWTATQNVGGTPDAILTTTAGGGGTSQITGVGNAWKIVPGMTATDLTNSGNIVGGFVICGVDTSSGTNTPFSGTVTLGVAYNPWTGVCTGSSTVGSGIAGNQLQFTGCGYPYAGTPGSGTPEPWLGNCAGTAYFFGDIAGGADGTQGGLIFAINDHGHRRGLASSNWQDAHLSEIALGNGGDNGAQLDATSYGVSLEDSSRININDVSMQGSSNSLYDNNTTGKTDGVGVVNPIFATSNIGAMTLQTGPGSNTVLSVVGAKGDTDGVAFFSQNQLSATIEANNLPGVEPVYGLDTSTTPNPDAATTTTGCANVFAAGPQCQLGGGQFTVGVDGTINAPVAASVNSSGWRLNGGVSGSGNVTVAPNKSDTRTGMGGAAGNISLIIAGNEDVRLDSWHHTSFNGTAPGVTSGSSPPASVAGNEIVGRVTIGGGNPTTVVLNFNHTWNNLPVCTATDEKTSGANPLTVTAVTASSVTFTAHTAMNSAIPDQVSYTCLGYR